MGSLGAKVIVGFGTFLWCVVLSCNLFVSYDGTSLYTSFCSLMGYTTSLTSKLVDILSNLELFSNLLEAIYPGWSMSSSTYSSSSSFITSVYIKCQY